jgi:hypothetical protein
LGEFYARRAIILSYIGRPGRIVGFEKANLRMIGCPSPPISHRQAPRRSGGARGGRSCLETATKTLFARAKSGSERIRGIPAKPRPIHAHESRHVGAQAHGCPVHVEGKESWSWVESSGGGGGGFRSRVGSFRCMRLARTSRTSSRKPRVSSLIFCRARRRR